MWHEHNKQYEEFLIEYERLHLKCPKCEEIGNFTKTNKSYIFDYNHPERYVDKNKCVCKECGSVHGYHQRIS